MRAAHRGLLIAAAAAALFSVASQAHAQNAKTYRYGKAGNWTVQAVYDNRQRLSHCSAGVRYKSGVQVYLIQYAHRGWSVQFFDKGWPKRPVSTFPATLKVDGRTVMETRGRFRGRSAFINMGKRQERVRAIMRGRIMTIISPTGKSNFRLTGSSAAAKVVRRCMAKHNRRGSDAFAAKPPSGAFGATPKPSSGAFGDTRKSASGAFGSNKVRRPRPAKKKGTHAKFSRAQTLEYAVRYLAKAKRRYEILPTGKTYFKNFPVNWRYVTGRRGGMMVLRTTRFNAEKAMQSLLGDQAKWCKGRSATDRRPTSGSSGRRLARARGMCEVGGKVSTYDYSVAELSGNRLLMIIESTPASVGGAVSSRSRGPSTQGLEPAPRSRRAPASSQSNTNPPDATRRQPDLNEL